MFDSWSKKENWNLSFHMIAIIEESATFKAAFSFDKGDVNNPSSGGKKLGEQHHSVAQKLFLDQPDLCWSWKAEHMDKLKDTPGSEIDNIWTMCLFSKCSYAYQNLKKIQSKFPWYKQMHALMGMSSVVDRSAITHSATLVDISMLAQNGAVCCMLSSLSQLSDLDVRNLKVNLQDGISRMIKNLTVKPPLPQSPIPQVPHHPPLVLLVVPPLLPQLLQNLPPLF